MRACIFCDRCGATHEYNLPGGIAVTGTMDLPWGWKEARVGPGLPTTLCTDCAKAVAESMKPRG